MKEITGEMDSVYDSVEGLIRSWPRGKIFMAQDLSELDSYDSVRHALCSLNEKRVIVRLARGIYCWPRIVGEYTFQTVLPSAEEIAETLAQKENVRIIPYGDQAAYRLGLTTFRISNLQYMTDGSPRVIHLSAEKKIIFNHTSEVKMFAFQNETMQLLSSAIRGMGEEYICTPEKTRIIRECLRSVPEKDFYNDINIPPAWVGKIIRDIWDS